MPDKPELIELLESEFDIIIYKAKRSGLTYPRILSCILHRLENMVNQCTAEAWLEKGDMKQ
jgi:hypothetical protein